MPPCRPTSLHFSSERWPARGFFGHYGVGLSSDEAASTFRLVGSSPLLLINVFFNRPSQCTRGAAWLGISVCPFPQCRLLHGSQPNELTVSFHFFKGAGTPHPKQLLTAFSTSASLAIVLRPHNFSRIQYIRKTTVQRVFEPGTFYTILTTILTIPTKIRFSPIFSPFSKKIL